MVVNPCLLIYGAEMTIA